MLETTGDIWEYADEAKPDAVCVLTNKTVAGGKLIMGGGNAREARVRFPHLPEIWADPWVAEGVRPGVQVTRYLSNPYLLVAFPTKTHPSEDSSLDLIVTSAEALKEHADTNMWSMVLLPRPGCGLGGLKWEDVGPIVGEILDDDRFIVFGYGVKPG